MFAGKTDARSTELAIDVFYTPVRPQTSFVARAGIKADLELGFYLDASMKARRIAVMF